MCYMYWHITTTLNRMAMMMCSNATEDRLTAMASHLKYYPLSFIISWIPNTIIRILQATDPNFNKSYDIAMAHVVLHGTFYQSVMNSVAYGWNPLVKEKWTELYLQIKGKNSLWPILFIQEDDKAERQSIGIGIFSRESSIEDDFAQENEPSKDTEIETRENSPIEMVAK